LPRWTLPIPPTNDQPPLKLRLGKLAINLVRFFAHGRILVCSRRASGREGPDRGEAWRKFNQIVLNQMVEFLVVLGDDDVV